MIKELTISITIIITIFILDLYTQNYTKTTISKTTQKLSELQQEISKNNFEQIEEKLNDTEKEWQEAHDKLAYYIEHDELEKVDTALVTMKSYIDSQDYTSASSELQKSIFVLEHIQKKNSFSLENIF